MRRMAMSFGISLVILGLCLAASRVSLFANVVITPGLILSSHLIPKSAWPSHCSDSPPIECTGGSPAWMYSYLVCGILIDGVLFTWPVLFLSRVLTRIFSK
jgi:hypothetical protein